MEEARQRRVLCYVAFVVTVTMVMLGLQLFAGLHN